MTTEQLAALKHPGNTAVIDGIHIKREAFRYLIAGFQYAYSIEDAIALVEALKQDVGVHDYDYRPGTSSALD